MNLGVWKSSKKQIKFLVDFHLEELTSVPFVSGVFCAKLRLLNGGSFKTFSDREEILDHRVLWNSHFQFECKLAATESTGVLDPCSCRVSVRRESQGGKSFQKMGFAKINLAEFAGGTTQSRLYLLEEYNSSTRANNALIKVTIGMRLKEGDFCFKVPEPPNPNPVMFPEPFNFSGSERHGLSEAVQGAEGEPSPSQSHNTGRLSSRQSSSSDSEGSLERKSGGGARSTLATTPVLEREKVGSSSRRVDASRVDPENLIDQLLRETNLDTNSSEGGGGLAIVIEKDGSAAVIEGCRSPTSPTQRSIKYSSSKD